MEHDANTRNATDDELVRLALDWPHGAPVPYYLLVELALRLDAALSVAEDADS